MSPHVTDNMGKSKNIRARAPNFTAEDDDHLLDVVEKYKSILENKKTDAVTIEEKTRTWATVAAEYNSTTRSYVRTAGSLHQHYKNLKKKAKKTTATKMCIPVNAEALIGCIDEYDEDWAEVSEGGAPSGDFFKTHYEHVNDTANQVDEARKHGIDKGGGPSKSSKDDAIMDKLRRLVGPAMDDTDTIDECDNCHNDSSLSDVQAASVEVKHPAGSRSCNLEEENNPLDSNFAGHTPVDTQAEAIAVPSTSKEGRLDPTNHRTNLKRPVHQNLDESNNKKPRKETVSDKFKALAEEKMGLVKLQYDLMSTQLKLEQEKMANVLLEREILNTKKIECEEMLAHSRIMRLAELEKNKKDS